MSIQIETKRGERNQLFKKPFHFQGITTWQKRPRREATPRPVQVIAMMMIAASCETMLIRGFFQKNILMIDYSVIFCQ